MCGLKQADMISYYHLFENISSSGYYSPITTTIGIQNYDTKNTKFCLCADNFGIEYFSDEYAHHLLTLLQTYNAVTVGM